MSVSVTLADGAVESIDPLGNAFALAVSGTPVAVTTVTTAPADGG
jgi:hypothetical protein